MSAAHFVDGEWQRAVEREKRDNRVAAKLLYEAALAGDALAFLAAAGNASDNSMDGWRLGFLKLVKLAYVDPTIRDAFLQVWIESKSIRRKADNDALLIRGLRILLPPYEGPPVVLYRGDRSPSLVGRRRRGISWTTDIEIARKSATDRRRYLEGGSCVLTAAAPAEAVISGSHAIGDHSEEQEFIVDPKLLRGVKIVERFEQLFDERLEAARLASAQSLEATAIECMATKA